MSAFALLIPPACLTAHLRRLTERSPTQQRISVAAAASVHGFPGPAEQAYLDEVTYSMTSILYSLLSMINDTRFL